MQTGVFACLWAAGLCVFAAGAPAQPVEFTADGFLKIDGRPRLVLGLYENPESDDVLKEVAAGGFNLVRVDKDKQALDRLQAHGLYGWIPLGSSLELKDGDEAGRAKLAETIQQYKEHPALLAWEAPDEALWMAWFTCYQWLTVDMPAMLKDQITRIAAEKGPERALEMQRTAEKASDLLWRSMWPEAEALLDKVWAELGIPNPQPDLYPSARIQAARQLGDDLTRGWELVRELDPAHVLWQNHAPMNSIADMRHHNRGVNAAGCDIYPMPFNSGVMGSMLKDTDVTAVGEFTDRNVAAAPGKACWMVLQGFGYKDIHAPFNPTDEINGRRPTYEETRFMAYDALLHGADALLYWGTSYIEKDSRLWKDILAVVKELRALEPAIVGTPPEQPPVVLAETNWAPFDGGDPKVMLRQAGDDWVLIAVNEARVGVAFEVKGLPDALNGRKLYRLYSDEERPVENGAFRHGIKTHDVHVYATSRRFQGQ